MKPSKNEESKSISTTSNEPYFQVREAINSHINEGKLIPETALKPHYKFKLGSKSYTIERNDITEKLYVVKPFTTFAIQEFIASKLFKRTLFNKVPKITITESGRLASMYMGTNYTPLSPLGVYDNINMHFILSNYSGLEEIISSCMRWADIDLNHKNLLPIIKEPFKEFWKVDHGWSLSSFFTQESDMRYAFFTRFSGYLKYIDLHKLLNAILKQTEVSDEEVEDIVFSRIYKLEKQNLIPNDSFCIGIDGYIDLDNNSSGYEDIYFKDMQEYGRFIVEKLKLQKQVLLEVANSIKVVIEIENFLKCPTIFREKLLTAKNPIDYTRQTIPACNFYFSNNLNEQNPFLSARNTVNYFRLKNINADIINIFKIDRFGKNGENDPFTAINLNNIHKPSNTFLIKCLDKNLKIEGMESLNYAVSKEFINQITIFYCQKRAIKISDKDPIEYACDAKIMLDTVHPIIYALVNKMHINRKPPLVFWNPLQNANHRQFNLVKFIHHFYMPDVFDLENLDKVNFTISYTKNFNNNQKYLYSENLGIESAYKEDNISYLSSL